MTTTRNHTTMRWIVGATIWVAYVLAAIPGTAFASWSDNNCDGDAGDPATWKRSQAKDYAQRAVNEGYEWGGGCFKLNDQDDTPNQPDSGGEGTDCSGFVFKTWALRAD